MGDCKEKVRWGKQVCYRTATYGALVVMEMFCILLMSHQYPGCEVCYLLPGKTGQRAYGILYYFSQQEVNLQLPQKKKKKNK